MYQSLPRYAILSMLVCATFRPGAFSQESPFAGLSATANGSQLYFVTALRQKGTDQPLWPKAFVRDAESLRLFEVRDPVFAPPAPLSSAQTSIDYIIRSVSVSADASVTAVAAMVECRGSPCRPIQPSTTRVRLAGFERIYDGVLELSANGCWARSRIDNRGTGPPAFQLVDVCGDRAVARLSSWDTFDSRRVVSNTGLAVVGQRFGLIVLSEIGAERIELPEPAYGASINASGDVAVTGGRTLRVIDPAAGSIRVLTGIRGVYPQISDHGDRILYRSFDDPNELRLTNRDGSSDRAVATVSGGLAEFLMTGDGRFVFVTTKDGRVLRMDLDSGAFTEWISRAPVLRKGPINPGSLIQWNGSGLAAGRDSALPPFPESLGGLRVRIGGSPLPIVSVAPDSVWLFIPPTVAGAGDAGPTIEVEYQDDSAEYFDAGAFTARIERNPKQFYPNSLGLIAHDDFRGPVTDADPARPGEKVRWYMSGLGPSKPPVPYDQPAPEGVLSRIPHRLQCSHANSPVEVAFTGLADPDVRQSRLLYDVLGLATTAGVYRVDLVLPARPSENRLSLMCRFDDYTSYLSGELWLRLPVSQMP